MQRTLSILLLVSLAATGCAATGEDLGGHATDLLEVAAEPLEVLSDGQWESAPPGCEGRLGANVSFWLASTEGLVAAVEPDGDVVCVDTVESVQDELNDTGRTEEAQSLGASFFATLSPLDVGGFDRGDPHPQPNTQPFTACTLLGAGCPVMPGDPNPQPNMQ